MDVIEKYKDKLDKFGYQIEDCSDWKAGEMKTDWKFNIIKKNDPTSLWNLCKDEKDVQRFLAFLEDKQAIEEAEKSEGKSCIPKDELGTILCKQIQHFNASDNNCLEVAECVRILTGNRGYVSHENNSHRRMIVHCEGLSAFGERFIINSGKHYISFWRKNGFNDNDWYSATRLDARQEKNYYCQLTLEREKRKMFNNS